MSWHRTGDTSDGQTQPSFDPTSLYSPGAGETDPSDSLSLSFGNPGGNGNGGQDSIEWSLSVSFNQDNSGGFDMTYGDTSGQSN